MKIEWFPAFRPPIHGVGLQPQSKKPRQRVQHAHVSQAEPGKLSVINGA